VMPLLHYNVSSVLAGHVVVVVADGSEVLETKNDVRSLTD